MSMTRMISGLRVMLQQFPLSFMASGMIWSDSGQVCQLNKSWAEDAQWLLHARAFHILSVACIPKKKKKYIYYMHTRFLCNYARQSRIKLAPNPLFEIALLRVYFCIDLLCNCVESFLFLVILAYLHCVIVFFCKVLFTVCRLQTYWQHISGELCGCFFLLITGLTNFDNFWYEYSWDNCPSNDHSFSYLTYCLFLHYLGKTEPTKYYFLYPVRYDYLINITHKNIFCSHLWLFGWHFIPLSILQLPTVKLLKMPAHYANISMEMLSLFIDSSIDSVLR